MVENGSVDKSGAEIGRLPRNPRLVKLLVLSPTAPPTEVPVSICGVVYRVYPKEASDDIMDQGRHTFQ